MVLRKWHILLVTIAFIAVTVVTASATFFVMKGDGTDPFLGDEGYSRLAGKYYAAKNGVPLNPEFYIELTEDGQWESLPNAYYEPDDNAWHRSVNLTHDIGMWYLHGNDHVLILDYHGDVAPDYSNYGQYQMALINENGQRLYDKSTGIYFVRRELGK